MNASESPSIESYRTAAHWRIIKLYWAVSLLLFVVLMVVGVIMRAAQGAAVISLGPDTFYQLMTLHGAGMVGAAGLAALAVNGFYLSRYVKLSPTVLGIALVLALLAVAMIAGSILIGRFAAGWTFLYPLPAQSLDTWSNGAAIAFTVGLLLLGVAFLLVYLDMAIGIIGRYGSLARGLGLHLLFRRGTIDVAHPPTVVASSMVIVVNVIGIMAGAIVLVLTLANLLAPKITPDALLMKHLIYFFGHVFINATIYSAITAVYEILPRYTRRRWSVSRAFLAAWLAATLMVMAVYPHHLLMDFAMPAWMAVVGQVVSYASGIPVLVITAYTGLMLVYRSGIVWDTTSSLAVLALFGWAAGVVPAIIDGMIRVNLLMHNTLWVPGHFHFYLLLGLLPMILASGNDISHTKPQPSRQGRFAVGIYAIGGVSLCLTFLVSGALSVPRRFAVHEPAWQALANWGAISGAFVWVGLLLLVVPVLLRLAAVQWVDAR